jgi:hypothetical protein
MAENEPKETQKGERRILSPGTWFFLSFLLWSIVLVPITMGAFFILRISVRIADLENQYSAVFGLAVGLILAAVAGYFYSSRARKRAE